MGSFSNVVKTISDTCHFQKLSDENKSNSEFDFHWNSSPTSIVCAFPYIIAFTSDSMEIRLLVNGNLVHTVTMAELHLITSKRDIYFATTAPEFIPKDSRIKGLEYEYENHTHDSPKDKAMKRIDEISNQKILEIRHKIEKLEANCNNNISDDEVITPAIHINHVTDGSLTNLSCPVAIQRARSLQNPKDNNRLLDDSKRHISKSNSCGEASTNVLVTEFSIPGQFQEPSVPPNSPKLLISSAESPLSPTKNHKKPVTPSKNHSHHGDSESPEKRKPLRIYRIPLSNLTGAHLHAAHNPHSTKVSKVQPNQIIEEHRAEIEASSENNGTDIPIIPTSHFL